MGANTLCGFDQHSGKTERFTTLRARVGGVHDGVWLMGRRAASPGGASMGTASRQALLGPNIGAHCRVDKPGVAGDSARVLILSTPIDCPWVLTFDGQRGNCIAHPPPHHLDASRDAV